MSDAGPALDELEGITLRATTAELRATIESHAGWRHDVPVDPPPLVFCNINIDDHQPGHIMVRLEDGRVTSVEIVYKPAEPGRARELVERFPLRCFPEELPMAAGFSEDRATIAVITLDGRTARILDAAGTHNRGDVDKIVRTFRPDDVAAGN